MLNTNEHNLSPESFSSLGYANYSPKKQRYLLEHYQNTEAYSLSDLIRNLTLKKRDRILVMKELARNPLFRDERVMKGTYQDLLAFRKAREAYGDY